MNERVKAHIAGIRRSLDETPAPMPRPTVVNKVFELGKLLTTTNPEQVPDPVMRADRRERALHLAVGILRGPIEDLPKAEMVLNAIKPEVSRRIREHLLFTAVALESDDSPV